MRKGNAVWVRKGDSDEEEPGVILSVKRGGGIEVRLTTSDETSVWDRDRVRIQEKTSRKRNSTAKTSLGAKEAAAVVTPSQAKPSPQNSKRRRTAGRNGSESPYFDRKSKGKQSAPEDASVEIYCQEANDSVAKLPSKKRKPKASLSKSSDDEEESGDDEPLGKLRRKPKAASKKKAAPSSNKKPKKKAAPSSSNKKPKKKKIEIVLKHADNSEDDDESEDEEDRPFKIDYAPSSRATCRRCDEIITKGSLRVSHVPLFRGKPGFVVYRHLKCALFSEDVNAVEDVGGYRRLKSEEDLQALSNRIEEAHIERVEEEKELTPDELIQTDFTEKIRPPPPGLTATMLPFQSEGVSWMYRQETETEVRGGILADEMGMGKTLQSIATILDNRPQLQHSRPGAKHAPGSSDLEDRQKEDALWRESAESWHHEMRMCNVPPKRQPRSYAKARAGTLVVCPVIALNQWKTEIEKFSEEGRLTVGIYHGPNRSSDMPPAVMQKYDVVLTTYQVLEQDFRKMMSPNKVKCPNCGNRFKIEKLRIHLKYFCGEGAQRTEAQARRRRNAPGGGNGPAGTRKTFGAGKKTKKVVHVKSKGDYDSDSDLSIVSDQDQDKPRPSRSAASAASSKLKKSVSSWTAERSDDESSFGSGSDSESSEEDEKSDASGESGSERSSDDASRLSNEDSESESDIRASMARNPNPKTVDNKKSAATKQKRFPVGTTFSKSFETGVFVGKIVAFKAPFYEVYYAEDGDSEELTHDELEKLLTPEDTSLERAREKQRQAMLAAHEEKSFSEPSGKKKGVKPSGKKKKNNSESKSATEEYDFDMNELINEAMSGAKFSQLHGFCWWRVILDEAHFIKTRSSQTAASAFSLVSIHRWCLSGTPLQNRVGELYSLIRFLRIDPMAHYLCKVKGCNCKSVHYRIKEGSCQDCGHRAFSHYSYFNRYVLNPIQRDGYSGDGRRAMFKLKNEVLDTTLLRRTKETRAADMNLPPRFVTIRPIRLHPRELDFYNALYTSTRATFDDYVTEDIMLDNYAHIFDLLTRLRQAVDHPYLIVHSKRNHEMRQAGRAQPTNGSMECMICHEPPTMKIVSSCCGSGFCRSCVVDYLGGAGEREASCPSCSEPLTIDLNQATTEAEDDGVLNMPQGYVDNSAVPSLKELTHVPSGSILRRINLAEFATSTKIEALVQELIQMRKSRPGSKALVFSQFVNMLDLTRWRLHSDPCLSEMGLGVRILHGGMNVKAREETLKSFREDNSVRVLLMSLKSGGVALNLTVASEVYLLDNWWNPAAEMQAIDRTHRLGQHRPIRAVRFITEGTVEERVLQLQEKKRLVFDGTVGRDAGSLKMLTVSDMKALFA